MEQETTLLKQQISQAQDEIAGLSEQVHAEEEAVKYLKEEIAANERLEKQHYVQKVRLLELARAVEEYESRRGEHLADIARARQKITDLNIRIIGLKNRLMQEAANELTRTKAAIYDIEERLRPSRDALARQNIVAPISGEVVNLQVFTVGGVIGPREPILDIVPDDNPLIIEAQVNVEDIDDLRLGQEADIRLSAYKARSTPLITGRVTYISADRLLDESTNLPYYQAHIEVDEEAMNVAPDLELYPGMPAEVFIKTGARTALDYILAPITQTLRRSMRES
jgi:HlyD family type I secretion membrane fusion protein